MRVQRPGRRRDGSSWNTELTLVALLVVGGAAVAGYMSSSIETTTAREFADSGPAAGPGNVFDARSAAAPRTDLAPRGARPSSLSMIEVTQRERSAYGPPTAGSNAAGSAPAGPPGSLNEAARLHGAPVSAFTKSFRERHPVMKAYSREWMSHPDLKRLNDDYMKDHDVMRFVRGLTASPSFGPLVRKIAADPQSHDLAVEFVTGLVTQAPAQLTSAAAQLVKDDKVVTSLVSSVAAALGLPPEMLSSLSGGAVDASSLSAARTAGATLDSWPGRSPRLQPR